MSAPAVAVAGLTVRYGEVTALSEVSLEIGAARVCGLVGMNGSGKSTLFKAVMGLVRPDRGTVLVGGEPPARARRSGAVGYVPQSESVDWTFPLSVGEVVMTGRYGRMGWTRRPRAADRAAAAAALERVELADLAGRQIGALSGGQRKRAFVARALAQDASVLLLDEPFAGIDKRSEATMTRLLRELAAAGRTVVVSTHELRALPRLCDEAVLLKNAVLAHGDPASVLHPDTLALAFGLDPLAEEPAA
ncbi:metal ABC transporter ATP-binding protein [Allonocardiopsis opalescens]|uniref:Manganese transport system ATP-binding protein n=1 Tax=Allonocardiopsis opalescens TaxID=1144618 RepID=A0A2T0QEU3_9ACTN|nr:metal ABC transporter ATP-binding protein [Allonocardiopsis opalescens]PRY02371.1 manganese transport system ATP-binding protein [Allonocardiopsis opalescens]